MGIKPTENTPWIATEDRLARLTGPLSSPMEGMHTPNEVDLDGYTDAKGITYIGMATRQPNGEYHVLANVNGCLCRVACNIRMVNDPPDFTPVDSKVVAR